MLPDLEVRFSDRSRDPVVPFVEFERLLFVVREAGRSVASISFVFEPLCVDLMRRVLSLSSSFVFDPAEPDLLVVPKEESAVWEDLVPRCDDLLVVVFFVAMLLYVVRCYVKKNLQSMAGIVRSTINSFQSVETEKSKKHKKCN